MIGIVVVSHSPRLAQAAVDLALEMVGSSPPPIAIAAGAGEGVIGTDATRVAAAIEEVSSPDGVLVFMDLGSAVLSATMALEFLAASAVERGGEVRLSNAPFVEGIIAGVVLAAAGAGLDEVEREASGAMDAKRGQLGQAAPMPAAPAVAGETGADVTLVNADGLHSRPAAAIVKAVSAFDAKVTISDVSSGKGPVAANSLIGIMSLGAKEGDVIRISAAGAQGAEAVEKLRAMALEGFGELPETA